ncbi:LLM class flavin-dependent oxidoreductase [Carbonactinospora thermoautotrophica]|uniref:LLM class flavin-dependent oxidoreductase n=1 Tax=Carbonactinospora thermoautotrophica TaxID=1469144 RepID=UPI0022701C85|nr:LLM class flavin-dependent oxidoreductase [Carbonactinospora thermoautotrophica]MCX9191885.1 LLM class flavin-dependent oxidoreductase [Carbonactinospora thermoautotrophica]
MRFGIFLLAGQFPGQDHTDALETAVAAAVAAEDAGFDDVWMAEHHFIPYGVCPSAVAFASYVLGRTRRIHAGTAISILSTRHPVALAEEAALLDQLSGGRFWLGVGRGGPWVDLEVFGTGLAAYEEGFPESLDLVLRWLTSPRVEASGTRYQFREVPVVPRPRTRPHPPVVVACTSPGTVELAARRGLPMLLGMHIGDAEKAELVNQYAAVARAAGHDPGAVRHLAAAVAYVADHREDAVKALRAAMPGWLERGLAGYQRVDGRPTERRDPAAYTDLLCSIHPVGSPDDCAARLAETAARTGIRHFILFVEGAGDRDRTLENIARLGREVLPRVLERIG